MLGVLMGKPFELSSDPATRTVTYIFRGTPSTSGTAPIAAAMTN
jgi:hypothetical protein